MLATTTLKDRHAQLVAEREQQQIRHIVADRQAEARIAELAAQLKAARTARETARRTWEKNDQAYGALLGDYAKLIADAKADDAAAAADEQTDEQPAETTDDAGDQWQQLLEQAADD